MQAHLGIKGVPPHMAALCSHPHSQTRAQDKLKFLLQPLVFPTALQRRTQLLYVCDSNAPAQRFHTTA